MDLDLLRILQELDDDDLEEFKLNLRQRQRGAVQVYDGIPRGFLHGASRVQIVDKMKELYTSDLAQVTAAILYEMRKFGLLQTLLGGTLSAPVVAESVGSSGAQAIVPYRPSAPALRYFPQEYLDFIICWSQNQEKMDRIVSDLNEIQVQMQIRSQEFRMPTETLQHLLGAAVSYMFAPGIALGSTLFLPLYPGSLLFMATSAAIATGEGYVLLQQFKNYFDQKRARELEKELEILLLQLMFKLVPLLLHLRDGTRTLVQGTIGDIQEVLQRNYESRSEGGFGWILLLAEQGRKICTDLSEIQERLSNSQHT